NSVFHWFDDLAGALVRYRDLLGPGGTILFSVFGPKTLWELKTVLDEAFGRWILLPAVAFPDYAGLKGMISDLFRHTAMEEVVVLREYRDTLSLFRSLKATGVASSRGGRPLRFTASKLSFIDGLYRRRFGSIMASYQVFLCEVS
ncbi:MAG: hypothetical protein ACP5J5_06065, partial [Dissulfurimicrobium sp.]